MMDCQFALMDHIELFNHQNPQVLNLRDYLNPFSVQPAFVFWIAPNQVQKFAHGLVELSQVPTSSVLRAAYHFECHTVCYL